MVNWYRVLSKLSVSETFTATVNNVVAMLRHLPVCLRLRRVRRSLARDLYSQALLPDILSFWITPPSILVSVSLNLAIDWNFNSRARCDCTLGRSLLRGLILSTRPSCILDLQQHFTKFCVSASESKMLKLLAPWKSIYWVSRTQMMVIVTQLPPIRAKMRKRREHYPNLETRSNRRP
jgi:hypothetical protein